MSEYEVSIYEINLSSYGTLAYYTSYIRGGLRYCIKKDGVTIEPDRFVLTDRIREHLVSLAATIEGMLWLKKTTKANRYECWHFKDRKVTCKRGKLRTRRNIMFIEPLSAYEYLEKWKENWVCVIIPKVKHEEVYLFEPKGPGIKEGILKYFERVHSYDQRGLEKFAAALYTIGASWFFIDKNDARKLDSIEWYPPVGAEYAFHCYTKASVYRAFAKTKERPFKDL